MSEPSAAELAAQEVVILYTNWKGETAERRIRPLHLWFGSTQWHPHAQWLLRALDLEKQAERDFALSDVHRWNSAP